MCGFAGVISWDNRYRTDRETLARMSACIAHRGPDGEGLYINHQDEISPGRPQVALAHRRLAIIDPDPRSNQPFTDGQGNLIVFNGEIYNFRELKKELSTLDPQYEWKTRSDTEVLLRAYAQWGEHCCERLNGMFAFAIWDDQQQLLFLARDRMGQKPLYIAAPWSEPPPADGRQAELPVIAFASELSALRPLGWLDLTIDQAALIYFLKWGYTDGLQIYRNVQQVAPAQCIDFSRKVECIGRHYYHTPFPSRVHHEPDPTPAQVRALTLQAVRRQLVADVPLGCFLSGGVDSSIIASAMKQAGHRTLTFSIGFDDPRYDESGYAKAVARHIGSEHHEFHVRPDAAGDLPKLAAAFGEPFADSSALPTHYLARETRRVVKVALSGDGGDELFGGYDRYRAMAWSERLSRIPFLLPVAAAAAEQFQAAEHPKSFGARARRFLEALNLPPAERYARYTHLFPSESCAELLRDSPGLKEIERYGNRVKVFNWLQRIYKDDVLTSRAIDWRRYLPGDLLTKVDRASMLHALEVRSPFMDHDLVTFAAGLTTRQLLKGGPKRMLREAFAKDLPDFVFKRRKMGFAVPIGEWLRSSLRPMLHGHLFAAGSFASAHFNLPVVRRLVEEHEQQRVDHSQRLYALLMLELWWDVHRARG